MTKAATPCFTPRIPSASLSTITIHSDIDTVGLRASDLDTIMHGVAEGGSLRASQWLHGEHAAYMANPLAGPGCLVESLHLETHSKRLFVARLEGSVCVGSESDTRKARQK